MATASYVRPVDLADLSPTLHEVHRLLALLQMRTGATYCLEVDGDSLTCRVSVVLRDGEPDESVTLSDPMSFGDAVDFLRCYCLHVDGEASHASH